MNKTLKRSAKTSYIYIYMELSSRVEPHDLSGHLSSSLVAFWHMIVQLSQENVIICLKLM